MVLAGERMNDTRTHTHTHTQLLKELERVYLPEEQFRRALRRGGMWRAGGCRTEAWPLGGCPIVQDIAAPTRTFTFTHTSTFVHPNNRIH